MIVAKHATGDQKRFMALMSFAPTPEQTAASNVEQYRASRRAQPAANPVDHDCGKLCWQTGLPGKGNHNLLELVATDAERGGKVPDLGDTFATREMRAEPEIPHGLDRQLIRSTLVAMYFYVG